MKNTTMCRGLAACLLLITSAKSTIAAEEVADTTHLLQEVVVTGTNSRVARNLLPYSVSVVGADRLNAAGSPQVLSDISVMVPSLFVSERGVFGFGVSNGGSGHIKLRGVGGDRASAVLMMVDGQPQFAGIYSHHVADFYDREYVERVEVLRGPGSVLYGSNAMAGAINIVTKNVRHDGVRTTVSSQYGSYNTWLSTVTNTTRYGRFSSLVSASYNRTDGNVKNFDFKQADVYAKVGYDISEQWKAGADYTFMNFRGNDPIYATLSNPESTAIYHQNVSRGDASLYATNRYERANGMVRAYYNYGNHYIDDPRHFHSTDDRFGASAYENVDLWHGASGTVGFDFDTYSGRIPMSGGTAHTPGALGTISRKTITEYSPYITLSQSLMGEMVNVNAGLRMANSDKFHTQWVPQFGFAINPGRGYTVKGTLAMGYRNPSFRELYLYRMANPDLEPEKMMNYEVSASKTFSHYLTIDATLYYSRGTNMIQVVDMKNVNTGRFINKGIELLARSRLRDNLSLFASYSYLHTSLSDLTGAPRQQYFLGVQWKPWQWLQVDGDIKGVGHLYVSADMHHQSYAVVSAKVTAAVCRYVELFVRADNLTDARYTINRGYAMPGITAFGGFKLTF